MSRQPPLRVGLIGCGGIAVSAHVPALQQLQSLVEVAMVSDIRSPAAESVAHTLGCEWTADYRVLLDDATIDTVLICTPEFAHAEQAVAAAESGKHVLCEKPMARTLDQADSMLRAAANAGVRLMIAHSRRFTPRYRRAHEMLEAGAIGEPVLVRENERRAQASAVVRPGWQPDPAKKSTWYAQSDYSLGTILHIGVHEMDLFRWFAGAEASSVYMEARITGPDQEVPDTVVIQVRFANDALGVCEIYNQAPVGYPNHHEFEVFGTRGMLRALDMDSVSLTSFDSGGARFPTAAESLLLVREAYALEQRLFFESILYDLPTPLDPHEGRAALELALAAVESAATGQRVSLAHA
jgi:myo-inositol 2-dehydrogenase/D-chiro-inositol 1-dehydrogenase/scyllo-inositol 2-dehydrogenase (NAD+)